MKRITVFCFMFFIICSCLLAKDDLLYHYDFENKTLFSLEGGMVRLYCDKNDLVYPGTYYLSKYNGNKIVEVEKVTIDKNYQKFILNDIDIVYKKMLDAGATTFWETELGEKDFDNAGSLCHGWSALPIYYYHLFKIVK